MNEKLNDIILHLISVDKALFVRERKSVTYAGFRKKRKKNPEQTEKLGISTI